mmetsp:Transcript_21233/g.37962  ORF Transcript_21233/g.37962 Transcript_21233/m.37962 type:complete len:150 (-) Transcript_21233:162-611(-)
MSSSSSSPRNTSYEVPKDQSLTAQTASPVATLSSHVDPLPHYMMSAACAGASAYSYATKMAPRISAMAGGFSLMYLFAGRLLSQGHARLGYDIGTITSLALLGTAYPAAKTSKDTYAVTMTALGGISSFSNFIKSYQMRTGKPKEMHEK